MERLELIFLGKGTSSKQIYIGFFDTRINGGCVVLDSRIEKFITSRDERVLSIGKVDGLAVSLKVGDFRSNLHKYRHFYCDYEEYSRYCRRKKLVPLMEL
ncbi:hypothetical protein COV15_02050 [Candidatus Woesearchaeota archaeon CG10_big_fil_rev_8_21_14_0_10_34_12]|nr:MAG: hypothetical protein COV15_02050 [Candidatus Woesearchaeota archaeon CG10_big_fil_rev_8_21_14_0_10_34_12]